MTDEAVPLQSTHHRQHPLIIRLRLHPQYRPKELEHVPPLYDAHAIPSREPRISILRAMIITKHIATRHICIFGDVEDGRIGMGWETEGDEEAGRLVDRGEWMGDEPDFVEVFVFDVELDAKAAFRSLGMPAIGAVSYSDWNSRRFLRFF